MPAGPSDPPPTKLAHELLADIESKAKALAKLRPESPYPKTILDAAAAMRKGIRAPLPEGWYWSGDNYLSLSRKGPIATVFANGRLMIFAGFEEGAAEVKRGKAKDAEAARVAVEDWFWSNGWPK